MLFPSPLINPHPWLCHRLEIDLQNHPHRYLLRNLILYPHYLHHHLLQPRLPQRIIQRGVYQNPSVRHRGRFPVMLRATRWWNTPKVCTMWGFITHIFNPNSRVSCTTVMKNIPKVHSYAPSRPSILASHAHCRRAFMMLPTTTRQSLYIAISILTRYRKEETISRGWLYAAKACVSPYLASYPISLRSF